MHAFINQSFRPGTDGEKEEVSFDGWLENAAAKVTAAKAAVEAAGEDDYIDPETLARVSYTVGECPHTEPERWAIHLDGIRQQLVEIKGSCFGGYSLKKWVAKANGLID